MITRKFQEHVNEAFDELNYRPRESVNLEDFQAKARDTITRGKSFEDVSNAVALMRFCLGNWKKIERLAEEKTELFDAFVYEDNTLLSILPKEKASGRFILTNALEDDDDLFTCLSADFEGDYATLPYAHGIFRVDEEDGTYLKKSLRSEKKLKLYSADDRFCGNLAINKDLELTLEKNDTDYELISYSTDIGIFDRDYIESLDPDEEEDDNELLGDVEWDLLDEDDTNIGVAMFDRFDTRLTPEFGILVSAAALLLFRNYMDVLDRKNRRLKRFNRFMWLQERRR